MTTSRQPWSTLIVESGETAILDADGEEIALFASGRDADLVVANQFASAKVNELETRLQAAMDALKGES